MNIDNDKFWSEVDKVVQDNYGKKLPYEKTVVELANRWGMGDKRASEIVEALVNEGKLSSRKAVSRNGVVVTVYSPVG